MFVDSHCHLDFPENRERLPQLLANMRDAGVEHALCVSVCLEDWPGLMDVVRAHPGLLSASVGVHPGYPDAEEPDEDRLVALAADPMVVAIGETGLDYYHGTGDLDWQRERFRVHVRAARKAGKPLIIHNRDAGADTLQILREEGAADVGGVMHCFTENWGIAKQALDIGFHISMSGIVSFRNAKVVHDVAQKVPADRLLIETDSPYLAPVPYRGKMNEPAWVKHVGEAVAVLRDTTPEEIGRLTTANYDRLFGRGRLR